MLKSTTVFEGNIQVQSDMEDGKINLSVECFFKSDSFGLMTNIVQSDPELDPHSSP